MQTLPPALAALSAYPQFIVYKTRPKANGKADKLPIDPNTGQMMPKGADWQNNEQYWAGFSRAAQTAEQLGQGYGVGFLFTKTDPFTFVDIDGAWNGSTWSPIATELCQAFAGAAVEVSQSGTGLHVIGTYVGPEPAHGCKNADLGLELYTSGRFVALTGTNAQGNAAQDVTAPLGATITRYFPAGASTGPTRPAEWTTEPREGYGGPTDDEELIEKMLASGGGAAQVFGGRASFADLWTANIETLGRAYPDNYADRPYDDSSADAALAAHLAFWTGGDCERVERLMWRSGLVREKWTAHKSYLQRTITGAVGRCTDIYTGGVLQKVEPQPLGELAPATVSGEPELVGGFQFMTAQQQIEHFKGCVYVQDVHRVLTPRGVLLRSEQFNATYGGYVFALDAGNDKTTKKAWEAFTESQAVRYPIADGMTFRPLMETGALIDEQGDTLANSYRPAQVHKVCGDASPFLRHLAKVLPDERDRSILLAYLAACVQHVGIKFQWAPLLQGAPGNGKTLFSWCVSYAVGRKYSHFPKASNIDSQFNAWMDCKLFIGVEDMHVPGHRQDVIENLKPLITNDRIAIEPKGVDEVTKFVCANFILNMNPKDGVKKPRNDRRFCVFYTAQQSAEDIRRDGMGGDYFPDLYNWLKGVGKYASLGPEYGYAIVAEYLSTYPIPDEFNPAGACHRAPDTSTTEQVLIHSRGSVEQEIMDAVEEGRQGFKGGWISSMALDRLLESRKMSRLIPINKRRDTLQELGYDWHPALDNGRVNNAIPMEGGKPKLFIRTDHPDRDIGAAALVVEAYINAQND